MLSAIPEIDSRREIFNPRASYRLHRQELEELSRRTGRPFHPLSADPKAVRAIRRHPGLVLDCLSSVMPPNKRVLVFKVIMPQLRVRQIGRAIIDRRDTIVILHRRRPIDVYISRAKAAHLQSWMNVDTTDVKVAIDAGEFIRWWSEADAWYRRLEAECWLRNKHVHHLTYEDDIDCGRVEMVRRFCAILAYYGITGFSIPPEDKLRGLSRQDRNQDPADRVVNWPEFRGRLAAMGCLEKAFAPFPNFRPGAWDRLRCRLSGARRANQPIEVTAARARRA